MGNQSQLILYLKSITHSSAHIGRNITINITSPVGIHFTLKKEVLPETQTNINNEIARLFSNTKQFQIPITVNIIERDKIFDDHGNTNYEFVIDANISEKINQSVQVSAYERRFLFWKKEAIFTLAFEIEVIAPKKTKRIPTVDNPEWTGDFKDDSEVMILARAIFGEARNSNLSNKARVAVGWSIRNRVENKNSLRYGGDNYHAVILKPKQYSSFNARDINRGLIENPLSNNNKIDLKAWQKCYEVAKKVYNNQVTDPTDGSNHYFDGSISPPTWAKEKYFKIKIDSFLFYALP